MLDRTPSPRAGVTRVILAAELPVIAAVAPFLLFPTPARLLALLALAPVWLSARIVTGRFIPHTPLNTAVSVLLVMVGISLWAALDILFSLGKVSGVVLGVLVFWAVVRWTTNAARLMLATAAFVLAGTSLAVIGLLGTHWTDKFPVFTPLIAMLPRVIRGIPGAADGFSPNAVAGCLILFLPLQAALLLGSPCWCCPHDQSGWRRRTFILVQLALLLLTAGTTLLLQSRGAWFGLVVATIAFLLWHRRWIPLVAIFGAGAVTAAAIGFEGFSKLAVSGGVGPGIDGTAPRVELWSRALYGIQDFAFTGMGMNHFRKVMPLLYPIFSISPKVDVVHAHNHFLQAALDLGVPGLIAYTAVWMVSGSLLVTTYRHANDATVRATASGLGMGLIAHFVFGLTDAIPLGAKVGVLFWLTLGLTVALHNVGSTVAVLSKRAE